MTAPAFLSPVAALPTALRSVIPVAVGMAALVVAAKVSVPFWPVPVTLQTLVVVCFAGLYGFRMGVLTLGVYLALGAAGLPVFAGTPERGLGLAYLMGPTGGYLAGFLAAAAVVGLLADRGWTRRPFGACLAVTVGTVVLMTLGWARLSDLMGAAQAWQAGILPFVPAEAVKIAMATLVLPVVNRLRR